MDILHVGTKENLVDDESLLVDDQYVASLTKSMFTYTSKWSLQCVICRYLTVSYSQSRVLFVYPSKVTNIKHLLDNGIISSLTKRCNSCQNNTKHYEIVKIQYPPTVLAIVINRFDQALRGSKNKDKINLDRDILVASNKYNLIGSIHHHGNTITSGHYTSNVYYAESAYTCNDSQIIPLTHFEPSDSVYMLFYTHDTN